MYSLQNFCTKTYEPDFILILIFYFSNIFDFINHYFSSHNSIYSSSFHYKHLILPLEPVFVSFVLNFSAPFKTYANGKTYLVRRQLDSSDQANAWLYDDHPTRPCSHHGTFCAPYASAPYALRISLSMKSSPFTPSVTSPTTPAPCLDFLFSRGLRKCPICKNPICIFTWRLPSSPQVPQHKQHHPACQPHDVLRLAETLDNYLVKKNPFCMCSLTRLPFTRLLYYF